MEHLRTFGLLDCDGQPFPARIERVLIQLIPRLRREFPSLQDDVGIAEILEEAGRRIRHREERAVIERLYGYAWVTVRSIAMSRMRLGPAKLSQKTLDSEASNARLSATPSSRGTAAELEQAVLLRELLQTLSKEERMICLWKKAGFSSQEIALYQRRTVVAVDTIFSRAKQKIRKALGIEDVTEASLPRSSAR
jgi:DNA-directed RNA polymerase specialized sigma24 family protein